IALKAAEYSENPGLYMLHKAAHGAVGGGISEAQGGEFAHGFASSFTAKVAGGAIHGSLEGLDSTGQAIWGTIGSAIVGGTVAEIGGGKFANGATTAAVQHIFNQLTVKRKHVLLVEGSAANELVEYKDKYGAVWTISNLIQSVNAESVANPI
ncbi:hypothetical protein MLD52_23185, partial [Puniceicoccaceae bacterium K14]|nr:hypothetical protein [Puniceicoccaceae bacterium K14]